MKTKTDENKRKLLQLIMSSNIITYFKKLVDKKILDDMNNYF